MKFLVTGGTGFIGASVVRNLLARGVPIVIGEANPDENVAATLQGAEVMAMDVADERAIATVFARHRDITHCIHLAYLMSAEVEANPALGVNVNVLGMVNMFEAAARNKLVRLVFTSSETVYGASQSVYGDRPVTEDDFCAPAAHFFTYGMMKILNEFMAQKYVAKHGISLACTRPAIVFGHGRKRGSLLWVEAFASQSARRRGCRSPAALVKPGFTRTIAPSRSSDLRSSRNSNISPTTMAATAPRARRSPLRFATGCPMLELNSTNRDRRRR
jgi:nucleoside-diphosphate-sugar epimerase